MKKYIIGLIFVLCSFSFQEASCQSLGSKEYMINDVIDLKSHRELFVDYFLIDRMEGTRLVLHKPRNEGTVLIFDKPWEGPFCGYCTIINNGDKYQLYYRGISTAGRDGRSDETTCYAESNDGIHWKKPELGLFEVSGTLKNNVVLANAAPVTHNFSPFLDSKPGVDSNQRYKALGGTEKSGLIAFVSPDGIHWEKLQEQAVFDKGMFDSQNVSFWSAAENCYVCYFRTWTEADYGGFRTVSRTTSTDFINWTEPEKMSFGDTPNEHLYTNQTHPYFRAPHIYIAIAARFMPGRKVVTDEQAKTLNVNPKYYNDCSDAIFMTSRGGNIYDRIFMESFIRPGIGLQNWVSRSNYPVLNVVQTSPVEMSIYVNHDYAQPTAHIHRYSIRLDGFVSVKAPYQGGEMITKLFAFKGSKLLINFRTSAAGEIRVEILDVDSNPIPGFSLDKSQTLIGNEIERVVVWEKKDDLRSLTGKPIRLRFVMKDADLFALKFE